MIRTAASLFQRQGYAATGWRQVIAESDTPWGSQSHHFPGGKEELAVEALTRSGSAYEGLVRQAFDGAHPADAIRAWASIAAEVLEASGWADGCPIATVALERSHESEALGTTCATAFAGWRRAIADGIEAAGADRDDAASLATLVLAAVEGALVLARAERDGGPLLTVGDQLAVHLEAQIPR